MAKLSAFADEVTDDFLEQVKYLAGEQVDYIEIRFVNQKNVMDLTRDELNDAKKMLQDNGISVCAIGSPIGKVKIDEPFGPHLDKFKHAVDLALFFEAPLIRMFSYYPPEGKDISDYRDEVMERMSAKVEILKDVDVTMVHENETDIYGHSAANCVDIVKTVNSPKLRLVYDPANFVWGQKITDNVEKCWPLMKPYVVHIHIKDWKIGEDIGSIPGEGDGQIKELLTELAALNYDGCLTMEPHLKAGGQFGGDTGPELFSKAIAAVRQLTADVGLKCE
ncbi:MAG TPA: sugar phosphate isomerase/epimerase family protein [Sedimentisphaerales bacterium]|nr:sugar phosphate isomerase/epimerase family protein [Sedimentisphaerales bacterium]